MTDELKPCPFCGGEAEIRSYRTYIDDIHGIGPKFYVECGECLSRRHLGERTESEAIADWNSRAERTCRFALEEDREMLAEKAACGPGEFVTQDMPDLLWTCSACGEQYRNGLDALPGWLKHCPNCGAKVVV